MAGGFILGSVAVSADVLPYISVAIKASFLKFAMCNKCKNNITKMFLDFLKILNCLFDRGFLLFFVKNLLCLESQKTLGGFHKICNAGTSKLLDVQCKFMFKLDCKILGYSYGRFQILAQACSW